MHHQQIVEEEITKKCVSGYSDFQVKAERASGEKSNEGSKYKLIL